MEDYSEGPLISPQLQAYSIPRRTGANKNGGAGDNLTGKKHTGTFRDNFLPNS
jgi:hypothetical protein